MPNLFYPAQRQRVLECSPIKPGQKVKVYNDRFESRFGEVVGIRKDNKIILLERPSFSAISLFAFDHFRDITEVHFIQDDVDVKRWLPLIEEQGVRHG